MVKLNLDNLSINTVMVLGAVAGAIYLLWKAKSAVDSIGDTWNNLDLNPFDEGSFLPNFFNDVNSRVTDFVESAGTDYYEAAAKAQGVDLTKYKPWVGGRGAVRPANAIYIKSGRTGSWFVPK